MQIISHSSAIQRRSAKITKDRIYFLPTLQCLKIFKERVCSGFCPVQCHWLQFRNWLAAQYIPAELRDRHLFRLRLSLFIVFKSWQVFSRQALCLGKNISRPLLCRSFTQELLVILITEMGKGVWTLVPAGIPVTPNAVCNNSWWVTCGNMHLEEPVFISQAVGAPGRTHVYNSNAKRSRMYLYIYGYTDVNMHITRILCVYKHTSCMSWQWSRNVPQFQKYLNS